MSDTTINIADEVLSRIGTATIVQSLTGPETDFVAVTEESSPIAHHVAIPDGMRHLDLTAEMDKLATKLQPWRRAGIAHLTDLDSFIAWANRNKGDTTAIFADTGAKPRLTCIADYLGGGAPVIDPITRDKNASHMRHRGVYEFPLSPEWKLWTGISGQLLEGGVFGEFVEANAKDFLEPTAALLAGGAPKDGIEAWEKKMLETARQLQGRFGQYATLVQLARSFEVYEVSNVAATLNRDTGESSIQFMNEHRQPDGSPITIPNLFMIAIPVFENGASYRIPLRFRYRKAGAGVKFVIQMHNPDIYLKDAIDEAIGIAAEKTELPLFRGSPESASA